MKHQHKYQRSPTNPSFEHCVVCFQVKFNGKIVNNMKDYLKAIKKAKKGEAIIFNEV